MRHSTQRFLRGSVVLLLVQLTFVGAWVPHALASRPDAAAHVEAPGSSACPVSHDGGHCLTCQATTLRVLGADTARLLVPTVLTGIRWHGATAPGIPTASATIKYPRAPPTPTA